MAAVAILDCRIHKILLADIGRWAQTYHFTKFCRNHSFHCRDVAIFRILNMAAAANLDFWNREILLVIVVSISMPNFVKIGQSVEKILKFFNFSRWRPSPSWIFEIRNFYLLTVSVGPRRIIVPNFVKIGCSVAEILQFFEFSRRRTPPSWIFEIAKLYWLLWSRGWQRISTPNFVKIGQSVAKILRFFDFSRWRPSAILD